MDAIDRAVESLAKTRAEKLQEKRIRFALLLARERAFHRYGLCSSWRPQ